MIVTIEFPHSEIFGSKPIRRLPEAYRSLITSFVAYQRQGIRRAPLVASKILSY